MRELRGIAGQRGIARTARQFHAFGERLETHGVTVAFVHAGHRRQPDETEAEPETDGREGLKSLEVLVAAYMSARDGKRVALPLEY